MKMPFLLRLAMRCGLLTLLTASTALAEDSQSDDDQAPITRLSLHAAAEPRPALRYRLLPSMLDLKPGNAAVYYNKAALMLRELPGSGKDDNRASEWMDLPLDKFPRAEAAETVGRWESVLREVGYAAHREQCDWQMPLREQAPYSITLPVVQQLRSVARVLAIKARLAIAAGKFEEAIATMQIGYAMARHAARGPTLIHALIGMVVSNHMTGQARELAQQPGAPNLYWAFSALPRPFISLDVAYEYEAASIYYWHPEWRDLDRVRSAAEWRRMYDDLVDGLREIDPNTAGEYDRLRVVGRAIKRYSRAKSWLVDRGWSAEAVEGMTAPQVVVLTTIGAYNDLGDQMVKWSHLPYSQARGRLSAAEKLAAEDARSREIVPLARMLLPAVDAARQAQARNDRTFALERAIEALRLYAAGHEGRLPKQLADVTEAPIPDDPVMGGPFGYRLSGETATLEAPSPPGLPAKYNGVRYEITIVR